MHEIASPEDSTNVDKYGEFINDAVEKAVELIKFAPSMSVSIAAASDWISVAFTSAATKSHSVCEKKKVTYDFRKENKKFLRFSYIHVGYDWKARTVIGIMVASTSERWGMEETWTEEQF